MLHRPENAKTSRTTWSQQIVCLGRDNAEHSEALALRLGDGGPEVITALGNLDLLHRKHVALFCSSKCPGELILRTYDLIQAIRERDATVIGGFHSPVEKECLTLLLRGKPKLIVCPARSIRGMRIPTAWRPALGDGHLLILSPFDDRPTRPTTESADTRNQFVSALADAILVAHASPGSKTEQLCRTILESGKRLYTLQSDHNAQLIAMGATTVRPQDAQTLLSQPSPGEG